jgi:tRNA-dihydrouridine synthase B
MNFLNSLKLQDQTFPVNLIQGPLAGVSCAPFRRLTWQYSKPAFSCTEMISCKTILHQPALTQRRYIKKSANEGPVCFQLAANDPQELAQATQRVTDYGADLVDLNCGCPVKKMRSKGMGSSLLMDPSRLYQMIYAMKRNTNVPVSIKIRVEGHSQDKFNSEIAQVINESGVDYVTVHGRHWTEHYETPCNYDEIRFFVENVKVPVIGNGDVACVESLKKMLATGCAGAMIGRAGVGQPWLIGRLMAELKQEQFVSPTSKEIAAIFLEHINELVELVGSEKVAILQARQLAKYYARGLKNRVEFTQIVNSCDTLQSLETVCGQYF